MYPVDAFPGFVPRFGLYQHHTYVVLDTHFEDRVSSSISRKWRSRDGNTDFDITINVSETPAIAREGMEKYLFLANTTPQRPTGLGDACILFPSPNSPSYKVAIGRVNLLLSVSSKTVKDGNAYRLVGVEPYGLAVALLRGLEFSLRGDRLIQGTPALPQGAVGAATAGALAAAATGAVSAAAPPPLPADQQATTLGDQAWLPLTAFAVPGAGVRYDRQTLRVELTYQGRSVSGVLLQPVLECGGERETLSQPLLLSPTGPVLPVEPVARLLGMATETLPGGGLALSGKTSAK